MSLDRSFNRDMDSWSNSNSFMDDSYGSYNSTYLDFDNNWPDPRQTPPFVRRNTHNSNAYRWQNSTQSNRHQGGSRNWFGNESFSDEQGGYNQQAWNSWGPDSRSRQDGDNFRRPQSVASGSHARPSRSQTRWEQEPDQMSSERDAQKTQWQNLTKQFGSSHFHREDPSSLESGLPFGAHTAQADSSGLEDSGSSGGGRKRPRSMDKGRQFSKSSRPEKFASRNDDTHSSNSSRASSMLDLTCAEATKPDSTSKQSKAHRLQTKSADGFGNKAGGLGMKKKQTLSKHKVASTSSVSDSKTKAGGEKTHESEEGNTGEGILERAERVCRELREKRQHTVPSRASVSAQRAGALRSVLSTSVHRFNLAHKSFLRGYMSDSNSAPSKSPARDSDAGSAAQNKQFSSSTTSEVMHPARSINSTPASLDSGADTAASSSTRSSHLQNTDIDRIRHSIERSVLSEGRMSRTNIRESSSVGLSPSASASATSSTLANKPPLPLSKEALTRMVNAPRSCTQRLQLARILRQHTATTAVRPRHIQLEGLYDHDDGDSIQDVLNNISGLEEIGDCAELMNIKLEDLTCEDKLRIAQMIEEADPTHRIPQMDIVDLGEEPSEKQRSDLPPRPRLSSSEPVNRETELSGGSRLSRSPRRAHAASSSPSRPLSLDDLDTESRSRQEDTADIVSLHSSTVDACSSSSTVTSAHMGSPVRPAPVYSSSPRPSRTCSMSPERAAGSADIVPIGGDVDRPSGQPADGALSDHVSHRPPSAPVPVDVSEVPVSTAATPGRPMSREAGVLHEVKGVCQRQDSVLSEMRVIDDELCGMYKSLIEIVARMSGLQRRRVQLQTEGEQLSQRRNDLLNGFYPYAAVSLDQEPPQPAEEERQQQRTSDGAADPAPIPTAMESNEQSSRQCSDRVAEQASCSVILPSWLSAHSSSSATSGPPARTSDNSVSRQETGPSSSTDHRSDICLSGSVTSSVGSATLHALSQSSSLNNSVDSVREVTSRPSGPLGAKRVSADDRAGRVMLSINGGSADSSADRDVTVSSVSSVSTEASLTAVKNRKRADSSSGIGSSVSAQSNFRKSIGSPLSDSGTPQNLSSTQGSQEDQSRSTQPRESSRIVIDSFLSPKATSTNITQNQNANKPKSAGVNVAYLGALSSDLVQQIVRNLPITSQLGEMNKPSMFVVRPGTSAMDVSSENLSGDAMVRSRSVSVEEFSGKSRTRTVSQISISSDLSSGDPTVSASIPPLKLYDDSEKAGSKTCTPRSESDAHSVTSGTSLGEQIKLFSERNSFSQETGFNPILIHSNGNEGAKMDQSSQNMPDCSVFLERLDMDNITIIPDAVREEDEIDRRKKRKSRKDRDQSLQRRRRFVSDTSSDGEGGKSTPVAGDSNSACGSPRRQLALSDDVEKMEADWGPEEDLNSTLVGSREQHSYVEKMEADWGPEEDLNSMLVGSREQHSQNDQSEDEEIGSSQAASVKTCAVSPSRLKLNPENLKTFRANVHRNLTAPPTTEADGGEVIGGQGASSENGPVVKESLKISGPSAPVVGLCIHNNLLYACFQGIGIRSYTMNGELSAEYPIADAQCFTITPVSSGSQHYLAVGCADHLTFLSINDQSVVSSLDTVLMVKCMQVIDTSLYVGLDCGGVVVVSLTTLQETRQFQASDCAVQSMAWTREGSTRLLIVASQDANIHVIDASSGLPVRFISGHQKTAFALCIWDHFVLSGSGDRKVMAHNVHNAQLAWELQDHKGIITSVCVDNGLLFTAGYDKVICCYDLKTQKLLHFMYGAGKCIVMKMTIHNSVLYTGNRDGEIEAIDLRDMGSFACECLSCTAVYGLKDHLWHHLVADHLPPNTQATRCPWAHCSTMLDTCSAPVKAGEHLRRHIDGSLESQPSGS
ncbi:hypothetical protein ACOMHN_065016 [Nucella lapillus]